MPLIPFSAQGFPFEMVDGPARERYYSWREWTQMLMRGCGGNVNFPAAALHHSQDVPEPTDPAARETWRIERQVARYAIINSLPREHIGSTLDFAVEQHSHLSPLQLRREILKQVARPSESDVQRGKDSINSFAYRGPGTLENDLLHMGYAIKELQEMHGRLPLSLQNALPPFSGELLWYNIERFFLDSIDTGYLVFISQLRTAWAAIKAQVPDRSMSLEGNERVYREGYITLLPQLISVDELSIPSAASRLQMEDRAGHGKRGKHGRVN